MKDWEATQDHVRGRVGDTIGQQREDRRETEIVKQEIQDQSEEDRRETEKIKREIREQKG